MIESERRYTLRRDTLPIRLPMVSQIKKRRIHPFKGGVRRFESAPTFFKGYLLRLRRAGLAPLRSCDLIIRTLHTMPRKGKR